MAEYLVHWGQVKNSPGDGDSSRLYTPPAMRETWVPSLGREDPLKKEMAIHSSTIAWKIPWTEEPGRLQSMGSQRVEHDWATSLTVVLVLISWGILYSVFHSAPVYIPSTNGQRFSFLYILATLVLSFSLLFFYNSHPNRCEVISHCGVFDLHFPDDKWYWAHFHVPVGHLYAFLEQCLFRSFAHF